MKEVQNCYHCGENCFEEIILEGKHFCCLGCRQVYQLLNENDLCNYYQLQHSPGIKAKGKYLGKRFDYLDDETVIVKLALFKSNELVNVRFSLPQMHCSSCVYLLEKLHQIESGIIHSKINFQQKEVFLSYNPSIISLRKVVELLAFIGYEPFISLDGSPGKQENKVTKKQIIQIGVAGFCFSNIMMLSFPEYFSGGYIELDHLQRTFNWLILVLSFPVLIYSASSIFRSAYKGLLQRKVNIDVPIALAIVITFSRSYFEIISKSGPGYLDSGTGIIFFMLIGRWFQNKTYGSLSFDRKYQSYFPLGITVKRDDKEVNIPLPKLIVGDIIIIRSNEMIPADAILVSGNANIDYSFVNGENYTQKKQVGDLLYAGGKQIGTSITLKAVKLPSQSYITELWNNSIFKKNKESNDSFVHPWSRYFTAILLSIAFIASIYWQWSDSSKVFSVLTSVLIVACPCSLLLSSTFTFGNMLRIIGQHKLFLKNANVIEALSGITHIVFDKTGTITNQEKMIVHYVGKPLSYEENNVLKLITSNSSHVLSQTVYNNIPENHLCDVTEINDYKEISGKGIAARTNDMDILIGNRLLVTPDLFDTDTKSSEVHVKINDSYKGFFEITHSYREGIEKMAADLNKKYTLHILSGDNNAEKKNLLKIFGEKTTFLFSVSPQGKLDYIKRLQNEGASVLMIGDGLNDAGALMQANVGIAVSENNANFSPACDGIIDGNVLKDLPSFLRYAKVVKWNVTIGFLLSLIYNAVGISFAVQGKLAPVVAAILMPLSSVSIVMVAMFTSWWSAKKIKLL